MMDDGRFIKYVITNSYVISDSILQIPCVSMEELAKCLSKNKIYGWICQISNDVIDENISWNIYIEDSIKKFACHT